MQHSTKSLDCSGMRSATISPTREGCGMPSLGFVLKLDSVDGSLHRPNRNSSTHCRPLIVGTAADEGL